MLWGMIRALQMIIISVVVSLPVPPLAFIFFQICLEFAQMDVFQGTDFFDSILDLKETAALNDNFELYGAESMSFILLSGSYLLI